MKMKNYFLMGLCTVALSMGFVACDDDEEADEFEVAANLDYSSKNATAWGNYMAVVSSLLKSDATSLYNAWNDSYAAEFKSHTGSYNSALDCVETIFDGCMDIAGEVGESKIGEPYNLKKAGRDTEALYAVESWYSWHSRDDYANNINSVRNAFLGTLDGSIAENSLYTALKNKDAGKAASLLNTINRTYNAILAIPQPFRNNIDSEEAKNAMDQCANLNEALESVKGYFQENITEDEILTPIVEQYVDVVVLPTYLDLMQKNTALDNAVKAFQASPSNANFSTCCNAWLAAREPWEKSEAFLFGPVADMGLDPNMDSWPLDQVGIVATLTSENWNSLTWTGEYDEDSKAIESAQTLRGFHTLEYLIFKDGKARTIN
ncbi:MAG: peptidase M75 [Bacteroidaceae bacterium]|nr:peptidase M75 [Bacteroidaceae bacterium]